MSLTNEWQPPELAAAELTYAVTNRVVEEFAQGHSIGDVLRELVQNEYDALGDGLLVTFGAERLEVDGTGQLIDRDGWRRLSVMLGTGRVVGDDRDVPQKLNGIGSKNHGLRSLFLIGDRIYVRSGGRQTVLDVYRGAPRAPLLDPSSVGLRGAHISVPYRQSGDSLLEAYDESRRERDLDQLATELAPTLLKLANPVTPRSLRAVTVRSTETDRLLTWKQRVKRLRRHRLGGDLLSRTIELRDATSVGTNRLTKISELEYQRSYPVPPEYRSQLFPDYYRVPGGRIRIGVSLQLKRNEPDVAHQGAFYYPLGFAHSSTGCAVSVSAPFEMNGERTVLATKSWNDWLLATAAEFALELLTNEWFASFGAAAYLALDERGLAAAPEFSNKIMQGLREGHCWATRVRDGRSRKPQFEVASQLRVGTSAGLEAVVSDKWRLDARLDDGRVRQMAVRVGAPAFTLAEVVRLRCAGEDASDLKTTFNNSAALYYTDFPKELANLDLQKRFAALFDSYQLTEANRDDLRGSATTVTAAGSLESPSKPLWVVDDAVAGVVPVAAAERLHPALAEYRTLRKLCKTFDVSDWAVTVASRAADGNASEEEEEALYRYLRRWPQNIRRGAWRTLRLAPIVRDHRGVWTAPADMVQRRAAGALRLERALHFPSAEIAHNRPLMRILRPRPKVVGADLVRYAQIVAANPELANEFEETLHQLRHLLSRPTVAQLRTIDFLRSTRGSLVPPEAAYVRSAHLVACVGEDATFAAGPHATLHARLGCGTEPRAADIASYLESLRTSGRSGPEEPRSLYPALVQALKHEQGDTASFSDEPIIFEGGAWHAPEDVLLGRRQRPIFAGAVPVIIAGALEQTYKALGAQTEPSQEHWMRFFEWIEARGGAGERRVSASDLAALRQAYVKLGSLPAWVSDRAPVLADSTGRLHSKAEARAQTYLINDDPRTAAAVSGSALPISFADLSDPNVRRFYLSSGVPLLSAARRAVSIGIGELRRSPPWFREPEELARLQRPSFASAVHAVANASGSRTAASRHQLTQALREITGIVFVTSLEDVYEIGRHRVRVPGTVAVDGNRIALEFVKRKSELHGLLARAAAGMAESTATLQPTLADAVYRLLTSDSTREMARYLEGRGVEWRGAMPEDDPIEESSDEDEGADERELLAETLKEQLLKKRRRTAPPPPPGSGNGSGSEPPEHKPRPPLPPLAEVELQEVPPSEWTPPERGGSGGGGGGGWRPRTPAEEEADRELGVRGEELIYRDEIKRVVARGHPASRVVWSARANPAADHDILSVADDGGDLWIEVKATMGRHGRFDWPSAEFDLALEARERYVLCRVYEAHTASPTVMKHGDPIGRLRTGEMRLDISSLAAEVAPLGPVLEAGRDVIAEAAE